MIEQNIFQFEGDCVSLVQDHRRQLEKIHGNTKLVCEFKSYVTDCITPICKMSVILLP